MSNRPKGRCYPALMAPAAPRGARFALPASAGAGADRRPDANGPRPGVGVRRRRGWDLNPRTSYPVTSLAGRPDRPDSGTSPCCEDQCYTARPAGSPAAGVGRRNSVGRPEWVGGTLAGQRTVGDGCRIRPAYDGGRSGGRADECTGLENRRPARARGFESLPLRRKQDQRGPSDTLAAGPCIRCRLCQGILTVCAAGSLVRLTSRWPQVTWRL